MPPRSSAIITFSITIIIIAVVVVVVVVIKRFGYSAARSRRRRFVGLGLGSRIRSWLRRWLGGGLLGRGARRMEVFGVLGCVTLPILHMRMELSFGFGAQMKCETRRDLGIGQYRGGWEHTDSHSLLLFFSPGPRPPSVVSCPSRLCPSQPHPAQVCSVACHPILPFPLPSRPVRSIDSGCVQVTSPPFFLHSFPDGMEHVSHVHTKRVKGGYTSAPWPRGSATRPRRFAPGRIYPASAVYEY